MAVQARIVGVSHQLSLHGANIGRLERSEKRTQATRLTRAPTAFEKSGESIGPACLSSTL